MGVDDSQTKNEKFGLFITEVILIDSPGDAFALQLRV